MRIFTRIKNAISRRIFRFIAETCHRRNIVITRSLANVGRERLIRTMYPDLYSDYIRLATLELCANEIRKNGVEGGGR